MLRLRRIALAVVSGLAALEVVLQVAALVTTFTAASPGPDAKDGAATVLCIGDSYTYGMGASDAWHFQSQLSDGRIISALYYNQNTAGFGTFFKLPPQPAASATAVFFRVRVSRRPCPRSLLWCATGICAHGSLASWACNAFWLGLTVNT